MHTTKLIALPTRLADALDSYYQTSAFAQKHFTKFDRTLTLEHINVAARRCGYEVEAATGKNAGTFILRRASQTLRVTRANFPNAEVRV